MKFSLDYNSAEYFTDLLGLFLIILPVFYLLPSARGRRILLSLSGLYLLFFIAPRLSLWFALYWVGVFGLQRLVAWAEIKADVIQKQTGKPAGLSAPIFWFSLIFTLLPMVVWKIYTDEFTQSFNLMGNEFVGLFGQTVWEIDLARNIIMPLGLSFASMRAADLIIKTYVGKFSALSFDRVMFYGLFPPILMTGPIIEYEEVQKNSETPRTPLADDLLVGAGRIAIGFVKVVFISALLQKSSLSLEYYEGQNTGVLWLTFVIYFWYFYINFSGYSDIAIGASRMLGFKLLENFNYPFFKKNIADFWANWHMSLYRFARRNAFIPLGGYRPNTLSRALIGTMMVISLWHNLTIGMVIFGFYHAAALIAQRRFAAWQKEKGLNLDNNIAARIASIVVTHIFVLLSVPLLVVPWEEVGTFYLALMGVR